MASIKQKLSEKLGLKYFRKLDSKAIGSKFQKDVYFLDESERKAIFKVGKQAVINSFIVGAVTSAVTTFILFRYGKNLMSIKDYLNKSNLEVLLFILIASVSTSLVEMVFLFFEGLKKSFKITQAAHLDLFPDDNDETFAARSIVRGALELPNPKNSEIKVDFFKENSKIKTFLKKIVIKTKASASSVLFKLLFKKMLGKAISRAYLSIVSIPLIGFWDAFETRFLIREIQIRVLGPSAVTEFSENYTTIKNKISYQAQLEILRAVACIIVTSQTLHPNLEYLFKELKKQFEINIRNSKLDEIDVFIKRLAELTPAEQTFVLYVLEFAAVIDGKITKKERELLISAFKTCNVNYDYNKTKQSLILFRKGKIKSWTDKNLSSAN